MSSGTATIELKDVVLDTKEGPSEPVKGEQQLPLHTSRLSSKQPTKFRHRLSGKGKSARPSSRIWHNQHLFIEMDEYSDEAWQETRRWNWGLEEDLTANISEDEQHHKHRKLVWSKPHLPEISMSAMNKLMRVFQPGKIYLDAEADTLDEAIEFICNDLHDMQHFDDEKVAAIRACLQRHHEMRTKRHKFHVAQKASPKNNVRSPDQIAQLAAIEAVEPLALGASPDDGSAGKPNAIGGVAAGSKQFTIADDEDDDEDDPDVSDVECSSEGEIDRPEDYELLRPDVEEEAMLIMIGEIEGLHDEFEIVAFIRLRSLVEAELECDIRARFLVVMLGCPENENMGRTNRAGVGLAIAAMFSDDDVVRKAYAAFDPEHIRRSIEDRMDHLHIVPRLSRPSTKGINKRVSRMEVAVEEYQILPQEDRWTARAQIKGGFSIHNLFKAIQTYAVALMLGIVAALIWANVAPENYTYWFGPEVHHHEVHDDHDDHSNHSNYTTHTVVHTTDLLADDHDDISCVTEANLTYNISEVHPVLFDVTLFGHQVTPNFIINDILMCFFFGLCTAEIVLSFQPGGSLYPPSKKIINPLVSSVGGVLGPIVFYVIFMFAFQATGWFSDCLDTSLLIRGWCIPTATDISLAWVSAVLVFGATHPAVNYLLLLAIIDDAIGLIIIAAYYYDPLAPVEPIYLLVVLLAMALSFGLRKLEIKQWEFYVLIVGPVSWIGLIKARLHPALALCFIVPFIPIKPTKLKCIKHHKDAVQVNEGESHTYSTLHNYEHKTKGFSDFFVMFLFMLCNAGIVFETPGAMTTTIVVARGLGKVIGIMLFGYLATLCGGALPEGMDMRHLFIVGIICCVGLTVAIFVTAEAFPGEVSLLGEGKVAAILSLGFCVLAVVIGKTCCKFTKYRPRRSVNGEEEDDDSSESDDENLEDVVVTGMESRLREINKSVQKFEYKTHISRKQVIEVEEAADLE